MELTLANDIHDLPEADRCFLDAMMEWYHAQGMQADISASDIVGQFPTFVIRLASFTVIFRSDGGESPLGFSLTVYNQVGIPVDDRSYLYDDEGEQVPERLPHGAVVVDGRKPMDFVPVNPAHPKFTPSQ